MSIHPLVCRFLDPGCLPPILKNYMATPPPSRVCISANINQWWVYRWNECVATCHIPRSIPNEIFSSSQMKKKPNSPVRVHKRRDLVLSIKRTFLLANLLVPFTRFQMNSPLRGVSSRALTLTIKSIQSKHSLWDCIANKKKITKLFPSYWYSGMKKIGGEESLLLFLFNYWRAITGSERDTDASLPHS